MSEYVEKNAGYVNTNENAYKAALARRRQEQRIKNIEKNASKYEELEKRINTLENLVEQLLKEKE